MGHRTTEEGKGTQKSGNVDWGYWGKKRGKNVGKGTAGEREEEMRKQDEYRRMIEGKQKDMNNAENNH